MLQPPVSKMRVGSGPVIFGGGVGADAFVVPGLALFLGLALDLVDLGLLDLRVVVFLDPFFGGMMILWPGAKNTLLSNKTKTKQNNPKLLYCK